MSDPIKVLDNGYVLKIASMGDEELIIRAARQSTDGSFVSWGPYEGHPKGDAGLLSYLYRNQHMTPFEMCELTVEVQLPIFVAREWMRHRTFSYNEASARYSVMPNIHYVPERNRITKQAKTNKQSSGDEWVEPNIAEAVVGYMAHEQKLIYKAYQGIIDSGVAREVARINTPVSRYTRFWCKGNLRNWLHFLKLRMDAGAQLEIREYANAIGDLIAEQWPLTWNLFVNHDLHSRKLSQSEAHEFGVWEKEREDFMKWKAIRGANGVW
jgi:thymidylate synthase (FAD)